MTESPLTRHAGPIALAAGALLVATDLGRYPLVGNGLALAADPVLQALNAAYFVAFVGLMLALVATHRRYEAATGRFGLVAFVVAVLGTMTQGGNMWFDAFVGPWLAEVLPAAFSQPRPVILQIGGLLAYLSFAVGWAMYGIALLRARAVPVALGGALVVGGLLAYNSGRPPYGALLGLAVAALGAWLVNQDRTSRRPVAL